MAETEILHRLYSHAAMDVFSPQGWQNVRVDERDAGEVVPAEVLSELDALMAKTSPSGSGAGWSIRRFAAGADTYACVIVSYPEVVEDDGERPGLLTHARLARVPSEQAWLDAFALVELAENFAIADVRAAAPEERLRRYLDLLSGESAITMREVSTADLDLPRAFLCDALNGWLATLNGRQQIRIALPAPIADLARAWAALPVALQRTSAWAVHVQDGCPVDVIFANTGKSARQVGSKALTDFVARYVNLLLDSPHDFSAVLRNPEMTTVTKLNDALQKAEPLFILGAGATDMQKKKTKDDVPLPPMRGELDNDLTAELDRQYRAMESSLRNYIDQRLTAMEARAPQREAAAATSWTWTRVLALVGIPLVSAVLASGLTMLLMRRPTPTDPPITETTMDTTDTFEPTETTPTIPTTSTNVEAVRDLVAAAEKDNTWAGRLFAKANGPIIAATIEERLPGNDRVRAMLPDIRNGTVAKPADVRAVLLEAIAGTNNVSALKRNPCAKSSANDLTTLQGEIILRWLAGENCS